MLKTKEIKINETEYTLQKLPVKQAFDLREQWLNQYGGVNQPKMYELVLENIVVKPKKKIEDFEEMWELDEVVTTAIDFQYGKNQGK